VAMVIVWMSKQWPCLEKWPVWRGFSCVPAGKPADLREGQGSR
jgi:hypothetical protein